MTKVAHTVLIPRSQIADRVSELGRQLAKDLRADLEAMGESEPHEVVIIPVLVGSILFVADLVRHVDLNMSMRVVTVSSYPGATTESKGAALKGALPPDLAGRHVVIMDDILDTGNTLAMLKRLVLEQNPASVRICVMLRKEIPREGEADLTPEYVGFDIPDVFVVGYGLDYDGLYRNLPDIVILEDPESV